MDANYQNFISYLTNNEIRFDNNQAARLVRFGYNIDVGTIEIVVDFEHTNRIGFFSFLNMNVTDSRKINALELVNYFNESLNYGSIVISQSNQLVYKIMFTTFDNPVQDEQWAEFIFRLWSISRDIYPLFGRILFTQEDAKSIFDEFLRSKERLKEMDHDDPKSQINPNDKDGNMLFGKDFKDWYLQN